MVLSFEEFIKENQINEFGSLLKKIFEPYKKFDPKRPREQSEHGKNAARQSEEIKKRREEIERNNRELRQKEDEEDRIARERIRQEKQKERDRYEESKRR